MQSRFSAKTGLLFLLTIVPVLVLFFLYLFGKNQYNLDLYPASGAFLSDKKPAEFGVILLPSSSDLSDFQKRAYTAQMSRLSRFIGSLPLGPQVFAYGSDSLALRPFFPAIKSVSLPTDFSSVYLSDTVLPITTAKGEAKKRLPKLPRAYFFDNNLALRGVYCMTESPYIDTLILEYKIFTNP